jgi:putative phage-type endonuclease
MKIIECQQGSEEWYQARLGKVTGTGFQKVLAKGQGKTRKSYMMQLAAERLTGLCQESFTNAAMELGTENEPAARACYEAVNDVSVLQVGFCESDIEHMVGVSPDGLVDNDGIIEIKCPNTTTHIDYILKNKPPTTYKAQIQGILWVTGRQWCDFISYDPRMKSRKYFCLRIQRDEEYINNLDSQVLIFLDELQELMDKISGSVPF